MKYPPLSSALVILVLGAGALTGCSKSGPTTTAAPVPEPRRNTAESLGFVPDPESYNQNPPPAAATAPASSPASTGKLNNAPIRRTLTGKDGRTLEAVLLSRTDTAVKIRRLADSAEFTIPLATLSAADQTFIQQSAVPLSATR